MSWLSKLFSSRGRSPLQPVRKYRIIEQGGKFFVQQFYVSDEDSHAASQGVYDKWLTITDPFTDMDSVNSKFNELTFDLIKVIK